MLSTQIEILTWPGPNVIFEIGACEGEDSVGYARRFPRAQLWLFEPLPANFAKLDKTISRHPEINAKWFALALSDRNGRATFHVSSSRVADKDKSGNKSSSLLTPCEDKPEGLEWLEFPEAIEVPTETLDGFCKRHGVKWIDFLHMDVQGAELRVLAGAGRMLPRIRVIWMEVAFEKTYEGQPLEPETTKWMARCGFRKIHQVSYGSEADALYYNMRLSLSWPRFIALRLLQKVGLLRR